MFLAGINSDLLNSLIWDPVKTRFFFISLCCNQLNSVIGANANLFYHWVTTSYEWGTNGNYFYLWPRHVWPTFILTMGEKILAPDFRLLLHTEPDLLSKAKYLIDSVLYEAKVKNPALRFFLPWLILLLIHIWNRSNENFAWSPLKRMSSAYCVWTHLLQEKYAHLCILFNSPYSTMGHDVTCCFSPLLLRCVLLTVRRAVIYFIWLFLNL